MESGCGKRRGKKRRTNKTRRWRWVMIFFWIRCKHSIFQGAVEERWRRKKVLHNNRHLIPHRILLSLFFFKKRNNYKVVNHVSPLPTYTLLSWYFVWQKIKKKSSPKYEKKVLLSHCTLRLETASWRKENFFFRQKKLSDENEQRWKARIQRTR